MRHTVGARAQLLQSLRHEPEGARGVKRSTDRGFSLSNHDNRRSRSGIMLGGTLVLTKEAHLKEELVGFFMLFTFFIVAIIEILLFRQLSRFTAASQAKAIEAAHPLATPVELRAPQTPRTLVESMPSVTENTTRTLQYSPNEPAR